MEALREHAQWDEAATLPPADDLPAWRSRSRRRAFWSGRRCGRRADPADRHAGRGGRDPRSHVHAAVPDARLDRPVAALAEWHDGSGLTVWSHSQGIFVIRSALAQALGIERDTVHAIHVEGPGCYGHNGADDVALEAALLAVPCRDGRCSSSGCARRSMCGNRTARRWSSRCRRASTPTDVCATGITTRGATRTCTARSRSANARLSSPPGTVSVRCRRGSRSR